MRKWTSSDIKKLESKGANINWQDKPTQQKIIASGIRLDIKLLSVNGAWQGRRFKTPAYKAFEKECLLRLPNCKLPKPPYEVLYKFGFTSRLSDMLNPEKLITDILCKRYGFDDRDIFKMTLEKEIVKTGDGYFSFDILHYPKK